MATKFTKNIDTLEENQWYQETFGSDVILIIVLY